ncbi:MAG: hypothetical protein QXV73_04070 [Candidatus Micrarchaeia archaeon]
MEQLIKDPSIQFAQEVTSKITGKGNISIDDINRLQLVSIAKEIEALTPYYNALNENMKQMQETFKQKASTLDKYSEKTVPILQEAEKVVSYKIEEPPKMEQFTTPKTTGDIIFKQIIPSMLSIFAFVNPGKYGENITMVNSLYTAFKNADKEQYEQALKEWQIKTETEIKNREIQLKALDYKLKANDIAFKTELEKLGINVDMLKAQVATQLEAIKSIKENFNLIRNTLKDIVTSKLEKKKTEIMASLKAKEKLIVLHNPKTGDTKYVPESRIDLLNYYGSIGYEPKETLGSLEKDRLIPQNEKEQVGGKPKEQKMQLPTLTREDVNKAPQLLAGEKIMSYEFKNDGRLLSVKTTTGRKFDLPVYEYNGKKVVTIGGQIIPLAR